MPDHRFHPGKRLVPVSKLLATSVLTEDCALRRALAGEEAVFGGIADSALDRVVRAQALIGLERFQTLLRRGA